MSSKDVFRALVEVPWVVFIVYWIIGGLKTLAAREKESRVSRFTVLMVEVVGYVLVFSESTGIGFLGTRFMARTMTSAILGVMLVWSGVGLAIWARYHLAEYWSARVTIKEGHRLIRSGPYTHLRHPIYSGLVLATIGSTVVIDEWRCILGTSLVLAGYCLKANKEEAMLSQKFPEAFREHQKHTGFLIPRFY